MMHIIGPDPSIVHQSVNEIKTGLIAAGSFVTGLATIPGLRRLDRARRRHAKPRDWPTTYSLPSDLEVEIDQQAAQWAARNGKPYAAPIAASLAKTAHRLYQSTLHDNSGPD